MPTGTVEFSQIWDELPASLLQHLKSTKSNTFEIDICVMWKFLCNMLRGALVSVVFGLAGAFVLRSTFA
ncbi:hypothetical protein SprV_0401424600 [Sparganum proliferum]